MYKSTKKSKQLESIKKKLAAATAMLMVASTMMVSSTYAWFTLSTAPEVTGISTTVGANGNLEIALANNTGDASLVTSSAGDSMATKAVVDANLTWGNLVDLSDKSYGLDNVVLLPAKLNELESGVSVNNPLKYPVYGADGRVDTLNSGTQLAVYDSINSKWITKDNVYGVKAVGTVSGQSETVVAFREARSLLAQNASDAKTAARLALENNGDKLGNIIIKKAISDDATFDTTDLAALESMLAGLKSAMEPIGEALKYVALGRAASAEYAADGDTVLYEAVKAEINKGSDLATVLKVFYGTRTTSGDTVTITPAEEIPSVDVNEGVLISAYKKYLETDNAITKANEKITALKDDKTKTSYTWSEISGPLSGLVNYNQVTVNGMSVDDVSDNIGSLATGVIVTMPTGSGVISDIADLAGDYQANIVIDEVTYGELKVENVPATMNTAGINPDHLTNNSTYILNKGALTTSTGAGADATFTDTYGYVIDLFFRTNVAGSNLYLQTEAVDRVYSDSTEGATMGGGSTMVFRSEDTTTFSETQMRNLMQCIRLVFMEKDGTVIARGKLAVSGTNDSTVEGKAEIKGEIRLFDLVTTKDEEGNVISTTEVIRTDDEKTQKREDINLTALTQNEGKMVSVLVYLDGEKVDNTMVANYATSMTGTLNLQFASSANLVPMDNNQIRDLKVEDASSSGTTSGDSTSSEPTSGESTSGDSSSSEGE